MQDIVVETILFVPKRDAFFSEIVHGASNVDEVLEEFAGDVFVSRIVFGKFERDGEHVEAIHAHPTGAVGLLEMTACGKGSRAVKNADVVEAEETALEDVGAVRIFSIDPPGKVQQQFVKNLFEEGAIGDTADAAFDFINAPGGPSVDRRVYVSEGPLVGRKLPVGVHVPFAEEKDELLFCEIGINNRDRNAVESQVPRG